MLAMVFVIISTQAKVITSNFHYVLLIILGILTLYPLNSLLALVFSRVFGLGYGDAIALMYGVTAKNHAITMGIAVTAFSETLVALPAAVALLFKYR